MGSSSFERLWHVFWTKRQKYCNHGTLILTLENFFGQLWVYNYTNNNSNYHAFKNNLQSLLITRFIRFHSNAFNCEEDLADQFLKFKCLFTNLNTTQNEVASPPILSFDPENLHMTASQERLNVHSHHIYTLQVGS